MPGRPAPAPLAGERPTAWAGIGAPAAAPSPATAAAEARQPGEAIVYIENEQTAQAVQPTGERLSLGPAGPRPLRGRHRGGAAGRAPGSPVRQLQRQSRAGNTPRPHRPGEPVAGQAAEQAAGDQPPVRTPISSLSSPLSHASATPRSSPSPGDGHGGSPAPQRRRGSEAAVSPARLREVFMLTEILRPPLALRRRRRQ